jgi:CheY-specific phosphatase CheX/anti-anti-sigma regulatory factor
VWYDTVPITVKSNKNIIGSTMKIVVIKDKIALFTPEGFLDSTNAAQLISTPDLYALKSHQLSMILVSLKKVVFFNKNGITTLLTYLTKLQKEMHITIGFCDYNEQQYDAFFKFFDKKVSFSLFKTVDIALLFVGKIEIQNGKDHVLIYNEDITQRSLQAIEIFNRGYSPVVVHSSEALQERLKQKEEFIVIVEQTHLGIMVNTIATRLNDHSIIYYLKGFLDGSVMEQFDFTYHRNSLKIGFRCFMFDATRVSSLNIHAMSFFFKLLKMSEAYGAIVAMVGLEIDKIPKHFIQKLESAGMLFFKDESSFIDDERVLHCQDSITQGEQVSGRLTKPVVTRLPLWVAATMETLQIMIDKQAFKEEMKLQPFQPVGEGLIAGSIAFYGDIEGVISLIMPKELVKQSCVLLIGETSDDEKVLSDALSELLNIIAGKSKKLLKEEGVAIEITLPKSYLCIDDLVKLLDGVEGVQVNFSFDDYPFTFYLSP